MEKIIYIGHSYHLKTASTRFLINILEQEFNVIELVIQPDSDIDPSLLLVDRNNIFAVVLLQVDYLAPIFIAQGVRTIVIPMFDGSEHMPDVHWQLSNQATFISFSRHLHAKISRSGGVSKLFKYFPKPVDEIELPSFKSLRGFVWLRRPVDGVTLQIVSNLTGGQLDTLHIHDAPDGEPSPFSREPVDFGKTRVTRSTWFPDKSDLELVINRSNIYIAPRLSEGIGMGFLEAMSKGMVVFANNSSTHNEYIANWINGILFDTSVASSPYLASTTLYDLSRNAWRTVCIGHEKWITSSSQIVTVIKQTKLPVIPQVDLDSLIKNIPTAYNAGFSTYKSFLERNKNAIGVFSPDLKVFDEAIGVSLFTNNIGNKALLKSDFIQFGDSKAREYLVNGWSHDEKTHVWIEGTFASLEFSIDDVSAQDYNQIVIRLYSIAPANSGIQASFILNDNLIGTGFVNGEWIELSFPISSGVIAANNVLKIFCDKSFAAPPDHRVLSLALGRIEFLSSHNSVVSLH